MPKMNEKAKGILKKIKEFQFVATLLFLIDFLVIFQDSSLTFQKQHLLLSLVNNAVLKAKHKLGNFEKESSNFENEFFNSIDGEIYKNISLTNVENGKKNSLIPIIIIIKRFPMKLSTWMKCFAALTTI